MSHLSNTVLATAIGALMTLSAPALVHAKNSNSLGGGVKCTWVLVSSIGNTNVHKQVCRKSGV
jgi:hypothetical protein